MLGKTCGDISESLEKSMGTEFSHRKNEAVFVSCVLVWSYNKHRRNMTKIKKCTNSKYQVMLGKVCKQRPKVTQSFWS